MSIVVGMFCYRITSRNMPISQLEIDDDWTTRYGDWTFDAAKFPYPSQLIAQLKSLLIPAVTVWVHPFVNTNSLAFQQLGLQGLLMNIKDVCGSLFLSYYVSLS